MAALVLKHRSKTQQISHNLCQFLRHKSSQKHKPKVVVSIPAPPSDLSLRLQEKLQTVNSLESFKSSVSSKGFLRFQKEYNPPPDVEARLQSVFETVALSATSLDTRLNDLPEKFQLFSACCKAFNHSIPNSMLHHFETLGDVVYFYNTPVEVTTPYEELTKRTDLPSNLHVQPDYLRYSPNKFPGKRQYFSGCVFPGRATVVTGLRYKKKYPGHKSNNPWHEYPII